MSQYYYLVSSLPMLEFGMKMPLSYNDFLLLCQEQLSFRDMHTIERTSMSPCEDIEDPSSTLGEWKRFDITLRNELARFRASKKSKDPLEYIRGEDSPDPFVSGFAHWAVSQDSPVDAELYLDRIRWDRIEGLQKGHYFDIDYLITYALKLQILERWQRINSVSGMQILQGLLTA